MSGGNGSDQEKKHAGNHFGKNASTNTVYLMDESNAKYKKLINRCRKGDQKALRDLYEELYPLVYRVNMRYLKNEHDAKDMTQDCFLKLFDSLKKFNFKGSFEGWVARMATRQCLDHFRRTKLEFEDIGNVDFQLKADDKNPKELMLKQMKESERVKEAINMLPDGYRTIVLLYAVEDYKHREIAEMLDITVGTSKSMYSRGKKHLLELLKTTEYTNE